MRWQQWVVVLLCAGAVPVGVVQWFRASAAPARSRPSAVSPDPYQDVTREAGLRYRLTPAKRPMRILESFGSGCGFLDYDGDGYQDILLIGTPRCALYRNGGNRTFTDTTAAAGLDAEGVWIGCATGDYDNDGDVDLFLTGYRRCALYQNQGNGTFRNVTRAAGIRSTPWSTSAAFADLDRDGRLDLYVGAYADFGPHTKQYCDPRHLGIKTSCRPFDYDPLMGQCYRGRPDGTFEDVTRKWGLDKTHGRTLGVAVADFDKDGWEDLYLANDEIEADLFRNQQGKGFKNVSVNTGTAYSSEGEVMGGMGVDWGDYDRDGWQDLAVGTFEFQPKPLFRNQGGRSFVTDPASRRIQTTTYPWVVWGTLLFDYDNDGWLDLLYVNSHVFDNVEQVAPDSRYRQPAGLFRNGQGSAFSAVESATLAVPAAARGLACGDYDNDGDQDLLIQDIDGAARLLENRGAGNANWVQVSVRGTRSNRDGIGARVEVTAGGATQTAELRTGRSYNSACDPRLIFGLGPAKQADRVTVKWPSGAVSWLDNVPAGKRLLVKEP